MTFEEIRSFYKKYKVFIVGAALLLVLIGLILFLWQAGSNYFFNRGINKKKEAVNTAIQEISNINTQIANLEQKKVEKVTEIKQATEELTKEVFGREEIKKEANQALANYQKAVNSNANVDRTAEDILRKLEELEK